MTIKYFLSEFSLDFEGQEDHLAEQKQLIGLFFKELACSVHEEQGEQGEKRAE